MIDTPDTESVWTIVVGAGSGSRFGGRKQFERLGGERVIDRSRRVAETMSHGVVVVAPPEDAAVEGAVAGGATRSESVRAGLAQVPERASIVLVHDAARPLASPALYQSVIDAIVGGADAVIPATPVTDTVKVVENGEVVATANRSNLVTVQTPQGFRAHKLRRAYTSGFEGTDDAVLVELAGGHVATVPGEATNLKITDRADLAIAEALLPLVDAGSDVARDDAGDRVDGADR